MCNKQHHEHIITAQAQALSLVKLGKASFDNIRIYECECGCYHVTKMSVEEYRKIRDKNK